MPNEQLRESPRFPHVGTQRYAYVRQVHGSHSLGFNPDDLRNQGWSNAESTIAGSSRVLRPIILPSTGVEAGLMPSVVAELTQTATFNGDTNLNSTTELP